MKGEGELPRYHFMSNSATLDLTTLYEQWTDRLWPSGMEEGILRDVIFREKTSKVVNKINFTNNIELLLIFTDIVQKEEVQ